MKEHDGPPIVWVPNADAGDESGFCSFCGEERDQPHDWMACAKVLRGRAEDAEGRLYSFLVRAEEFARP